MTLWHGGELLLEPVISEGFAAPIMLGISVTADEFLPNLCVLSFDFSKASPVTLILMTMKDLQRGHVTALTWTGWRFTSLDTVWDWNIPACYNPSCTPGTGIFP